MRRPEQASGRGSAPTTPTCAPGDGPADPPGEAQPTATPPEPCGSLGELLHRRRAASILRECAAALREGHPMALIIEGDRGSGRSALLTAMAAGLGPAAVLRARCHAAEREFDFAVVGQLLDRLPAGDPGPGGAARPSREHGIFDRFYRAVRTEAERGPVVLAIDDVHLADPSSARWCSYLARRLDDLPVCLLVTVSPSGSMTGAVDPATADLLGDLGALAHCRVLETGPLCPDCAATLLSRRLGRPADPAFARRCHALTRGNPQVLDLLAGQLAAGCEVGTSASIDVAARLLAGAALGWLRQDEPVKAKVTEYFALCGDGALDLAAMLAGQGEDVTRATRSTLLKVGLLAQDKPDVFAHPRMSEAIADLVPPQERADVHARAATMLSQTGESAVRAAEHAMLAGAIGEPWARQVLQQAARQAASAGDWRRGARYLSRALLEPGPAQQTLVITADLAALEAHRDLAACRRRAAMAADLAGGDPQAASTLAVFATATLAAEDSEAAATFARLAATAAGEPADRAALLRLGAATLAGGQALTPEQAAAVRMAMRRAGGRTQDMAARQLLSAVALSTAGRGRGRRRCRALALRAAGGGPARFTDPVASTAACAALALTWAGELDAALDACAQGLEAARRMASRTDEALALLVRSEVCCQRGDLASAAGDAQQAVRLFEAAGAVSLHAAAKAALTRVRLMRGEPGAPAHASDLPTQSSVHPFLAALVLEARGMSAAAQGNRALAVRLHLEAGRQLMAAGLANPACSAWRSRSAGLLAGLGRSWEARMLAGNEVELARTWGAPGPLGRALVAAAAAHDGAARRDLLAEAVGVLEDSGCRLLLARALIRLGCDLHTDAGGPSRAGRELLERGLGLARECGAAALVVTARRAMHSVGARPRERPAPATLTSAERRVAELVVTGMSNQAVAASLTLSKRTVDTHLGRIYRKLGITGRAGLGEAISGPAGGDPQEAG